MPRSLAFAFHGFIFSDHLLQPPAGPIDEHIFQCWLARRDRTDLPGKRFDQPRNPLVAIGHFQPNGAVHYTAFATEALMQAASSTLASSARTATVFFIVFLETAAA